LISCGEGAPRSTPAVTFCELTTTTPLNRAGSDGRTTYIRVRYSAVSAGWTDHCPSSPIVVPGAGSEDWATPPIRNSSSTHPYSPTSSGLPNGQPFPPVTGPLTRATADRCPVMSAPLYLVRLPGELASARKEYTLRL